MELAEIRDAGAGGGDDLGIDDGRFRGKLPQHERDRRKSRREVVAVLAEQVHVASNLAWLDAVAIELCLVGPPLADRWAVAAVGA